jgi:predicted RNA-binding protein YlqC (UPF0109 family)
MPEHSSTAPEPSTSAQSLDYEALVRFLIEPFLDHPESLSLDCETQRSGRIWIRMAFNESDRGRVFGRGGRNIQAVRTVLKAAAAAADQSAHLDIHGMSPDDDKRTERRSPRPPRGRSRPRPS